MTKEQAINYLKSSGMSEEQIESVVDALKPDLDVVETRWIPCSERLPEKDVNVLAYHRNESFDYQYVSWIDDHSGHWCGFIGNLSDDVRAWQPLPTPYKAESEEVTK